MMDRTLKLKTMAMVWRDILVDSADIAYFCKKKYGKKPTVFMGVNGCKLPNEVYCPLICIIPGIKTEGADEEIQRYGLGISWVIKQPNVLVDGVEKAWSDDLDGSLIEFLGMYESDEFGQLIYEVLQSWLIENGSFPISKIEYSINTQAYFPQFPGNMILVTEIEPAMGEILEYERVKI